MPGINKLVTDTQLAQISAFIADKTIFTGDVRTAPDAKDVGLKVDGTVEGNINISEGGVIHIGPGGLVKGSSIEADYVYIEGRVEGKIIARRAIELTGSSSVKGEIQYLGDINLHNLAKVRANVTYTGRDAEN
jgi:cytoskeletal protein CcmA (bactofilin family)